MPPTFPRHKRRQANSTSVYSWSFQNDLGSHIWQELCERAREGFSSHDDCSSDQNSSMNIHTFDKAKNVFGIINSAPNRIQLDRFEDDDLEVDCDNSSYGRNSFLRSRSRGCSSDLSALDKQSCRDTSIDSDTDSDSDDQSLYFDCNSFNTSADNVVVDSREEEDEVNDPWGHFVDVLSSPREDSLKREENEKRTPHQSLLNFSWNPYSAPLTLRKENHRRYWLS